VVLCLICFISQVKTFKLEKIEPPQNIPEQEGQDLVKRLYELGLRPGIQFQISGKISFNTVTVIQYGQARLALNELEMSCLHGH
jgi:Fe2+ transport system protein FeoA